MVHGVIKRLRELGSVFNIVCKLVHERDEFVLDEADPDSLSHKSDPFSKDRGAVIGGYVVFRDEAKRVMHLETMSLEDFEKVRTSSKAPDSPAWKKWTHEMYRKAVLRRGAKYISVNNDKIRALLERDDSMFDFSQQRMVERVDPFSGPTIDGEATELGSSSAPAASQQFQEARAAALETPHRQQEQRREDEQKQPERPPAPMDLPDLSVAPMDTEKAIEGVTKILAIALDSEITAKDRQGNLKEAAATWKGAAPDYLHPLLKACIDITDWSIKCDSSGLPWAADHAMFVHKVKALLGVEKLNIGRYP
jgi:recombinational DNA repair protein RecT